MKNVVLKHKDAMDVVFYVIFSINCESVITVTGMWYNMGYNQNYKIMDDTIDINYTDICNWLVLDEPLEPYIYGKSFRNCKWRKLQ